MQKYVTFAGKKILKSSLKLQIIEKSGDHCHFTGKYKGAARNICNLKFNILNEIPQFSITV